MGEFIKTLLSLSVSGTLLLFFILGLKPICKNKFSKRWQYYVWLIVVLRFLLPFTPEPVNVGGLLGLFHTDAVIGENPAAPDMPLQAAAEGSGAERTQPGQAQAQGQAQTRNPARSQELEQTRSSTQSQELEQTPLPVQGQVQARPQAQEQGGENKTAFADARDPSSVYNYLFPVWAALSLALFARKIRIYQGFIRYVKAGNTKVPDISAFNLLSDCAGKLNVRTKVELYRNERIVSPMMIGFFRPGIILPDRELTDKELSYIFTHELVHCKRKDMFYKWLVQIVICAHWFNPFAYLLGKEVNQACELACDEKVISMLGEKERRGYGDMLISFLKADSTCQNALASVTLTEGAKQLKERLGAIMNFRKKTKVMAAISIVAACLLSIGGFALGAYTVAPASPAGQEAANTTVPGNAVDNGQETANTTVPGNAVGNGQEATNTTVPGNAVGNVQEAANTTVPGNAADNGQEATNTTVPGNAVDVGQEAVTTTVPGNAVDAGQATVNNTVSGNPAGIGQEAAKNAALAHAGVQEADTHYCNAWLEYENHRSVYYEVEFVAGNMEYEYDIDMYSGAVLNYETEDRGYTYPPSGGNSAGSSPVSSADIGQDAAKQIAFSHAGVSESQLYHLKVEKDEDSRGAEYEIKFKYNGMEYEYDIDAATGTILKYDCDND